jgi:hypothetical protein
MPLTKSEWLTDINSLMLCLERENKLIFKPFVEGHGGRGLLVVEKSTAGCTVNGKFLDTKSMESMIGSLNNYIITRFIFQAEYSKAIYPRTSNTIRFYTFYDTNKGSAFIHNALHRFGSDLSYPLDAYSRGGVFAEVDLSTGMLGAPFTRIRDNVVSLSSHPNTQHPVKGTIVPYWDDIKATILKAATLFDFALYLGWDVLVANDGFYILEVNIRPCQEFLQIISPALQDERVKDIVNTLFYTVEDSV